MTRGAADENAWRGVIAALANPDTRRVLGLLLAEQDASEHLASLPQNRRDRILRTLADARVIERNADEPRLRVERFAELLAAAPVERPTGIDRFFVDGRLEHYPARSDDRAAVLLSLADRTMPDPGERIDERTLTERLATLTDDPVTMRRYLVDAGLLDREPDGSAYRRGPTPSDSPAG